MKGLLIALVAAVVVLGACGTVEPQSEALVVVETFMSPGDSEVRVIVRHTRTVWGVMSDANPVDDADVVLMLDGVEVGLEPVGGGAYRIGLDSPLVSGMFAGVGVRWRGREAAASSRIPAPIRIDSLAVRPSPRAVEAVLIDSLQLGAPAPETGWVYLVDVSMWWTAAEVLDDSYIRARLEPEAAFAGPVVDFFLRSDHIASEAAAVVDGSLRRWDGVYAVRVSDPDARLPDHRLQLALLRSGADYARYASSRGAAERREPAGNVTGGIGIVAGVAVDSLHVVVEGVDGI